MARNIAVIPGDGTGPEVVEEGIKVLNAAAAASSLKLEYETYDFGGERYKRTGEILPDSALGELQKFDAIYLGAIGHPDVTPGLLEKGILLTIRFELEQYINLRPVRLYPGVWTPVRDKGPEDIDFVVVRENCGDVYKGLGDVENYGQPDEKATQVMVYTRPEVERCLRYAFEYTRERNKEKQLTLVGKTNVLTNVYGLWERVFHEMGERDYPDIKREYAHIDATTMWFVKNPEWFDVIVTGNMFGDIITDLGAMIQGGMGIAAGGNINPEGVSMFEPIGGSAPKYTGMNVVNPLAAIESGRMMLEHLGEKKAAKLIEDAVIKFLESGKLPGMSARDIEASGLGTSGIGDALVEIIEAAA
jgi:3-isopropylmalate dehydrogenase